MPVPMWMGKVNRRVFNPMEIKRGKRPVLTHVGRSSGREYHTPMDAHPVEGGFIFIVMYGPESDWVKNAIAAQKATLLKNGEHFDLIEPRILDKTAASELLSSSVKHPPDRLNVTEYLHMQIAG
ncbi:MAG: nitroreductase family deazaflavin-dependent oxidoreductase [Actinomycetota bacterium]